MAFLSFLDAPSFTVAKKGFLGSSMTVSVSHPKSYPKDSKLRSELKYGIVMKKASCHPNGDTTCPSTSNSMNITGSMAKSFRLKAYYEDKPELGDVHSELYEGTVGVV